MRLGEIRARRRAAQRRSRYVGSGEALSGMRIAILVDHGFERVELLEPQRVLEEHGASTDIVSSATRLVWSWTEHGRGEVFWVDVPLQNADPDRYDCLLLPGGVLSSDALRTRPQALGLVKAFFDAGKPVAAICHGPSILINAGVVAGRTLTSCRATAIDLANAGAVWRDEPAVVEGALVTGRAIPDIPAFTRAMLGTFLPAGQET
jgi:protease I